MLRVQEDTPPILLDRLQPHTFVGDVVTVPEMTTLLRAAPARGCGIQTGGGMFETGTKLMFDFLTEAR